MQNYIKLQNWRSGIFKIGFNVGLAANRTRYCFTPTSNNKYTPGIFSIYSFTNWGITSAPSKFQKIMDSLLSGMPNVVCFLDDILVTGKNRPEHIQNLRSVLSKLMLSGLNLAIHKCEFFKKEIQYLGYKIDKNGLHATQSKINAIKNARIPNNITTELKSFLELVNFYGKFIPNSAALLHPLYRLLKNAVIWKWSKSCDIS